LRSKRIGVTSLTLVTFGLGLTVWSQCMSSYHHIVTDDGGDGDRRTL